jgi:hypothetical protein
MFAAPDAEAVIAGVVPLVVDRRSRHKPRPYPRSDDEVVSMSNLNCTSRRSFDPLSQA